ncbi:MULTISPECIES: hypothetical protein [Chryseobacterium]|uniref:hypothetical protein n=1 Tax=Chryseobacterium TaxID=59732 RepID=UPI000A884EC0|nr:MULTISPECIES: hypothetical protein [Chryseobacterium]MCL8536716.1 hypothetical protein [Chryseobacterium gallinarum]
MKKLKRNELKKISGGITSAIIMCDENMNCPAGLCCTIDYVCRDKNKYPCV